MSDADTYRGMASRTDWAKTQVHQHSNYSCGKCGLRLPDPHAVYAHIEAEHPTPQRPKRKGRR